MSKVARQTKHCIVAVVSHQMGTSMQIGACDGSYAHMFTAALTKAEALELVSIIKDLAEDLPDPSRPGTPKGPITLGEKR